MRSGDLREPLIFGLLAILAAAAALTSLPVPLRTLLAAALVLHLPGGAVMMALATKYSRLERAVLGTALSIALAILFGFALNAIGGLTPAGWATGLCGFTIAVAASTAFMRRHAPPATRSTFDVPHVQKWHAAAIVASIVFTLAAVLLARNGAANHREFAFTDFWMVPVAGERPREATIGIRNVERETTSYSVAILADNAIISRLPSIELEPGATWTRMVSLVTPTKDEPRRTEAWLFRTDNPQIVYRKVWLPSVPIRSRSTASE